jgi:hypothetical protein
MKKVLVPLVLALAMVLAVTVTASAAPPESASHDTGPFDGVFHGHVYGSNNSRAQMSLDLNHSGSQVDGTVFLGSGLLVDAGWCGSGYVPSGAYYAAGETTPGKPRNLAAETTVNVSGMDINIELDGNVSTSGNVIEAEARIDVPWICGPDPVLAGTLYKAQ